jgi:hypothetical protein
MRRSLFLLMAVILLGWSSTVLRGGQAAGPAATPQRAGESAAAAEDERMSAMGRLASLARSGRLAKAIAKARLRSEGVQIDTADGDDDQLAAPNTQAENSIAVDSTGQHVVVGFNDARGFATSPVSVSGFMYSDDGGQTFTDGGQLPVNTVPVTSLGGTLYPQIFGDPDVKYLGGSNFIYFSIEVRRFSDPLTGTGTVQTMCFHRSTDNGHSWQGPFEITPATNPNGLLSGANARDAADKEFAAVDRSTGRVLMSWSNFTTTAIAPGGVEISTTYSDNVLGATPTWSPRVVVGATAADGQSSQPYFANNGTNAYVAWRRFSPAFTGYGQNVAFARSTDNGVTFSPAVNLTSDFFTADSILGNDRTNTSPSIAVDTSGGPNNGNIYVVYSNNNANDGADIMVQRSIDQGVSFSPPVAINSRPGADRPQWFPWATVDTTTGRAWVFYYDQGIAAAGDLSEASVQHSDDGGLTWSPPTPLSDRPFHAGHGNDTGQPNLGDYNQAVAQNDELFATFAITTPVGYNDGQPGTAFPTPDVFFKRLSGPNAPPTVHLETPAFSEPINSLIDAGDLVSFSVPLTNYVTNSINASTVSGLSSTLSTTTPGVTVTQASSAYPVLVPGATAPNSTPFTVQVAPSFAPGTSIEFVLNVSNSAGSINLPFTQATGTPISTLVFAESFDGIAPGSLPAGWTTSHGAGNNTVPWTTSNSNLGATTNMAFHRNANDGLSGNHTRFERLFSPLIPIPANSEYVTFDFDVVTDTEDDAYAHGTVLDPHQLAIRTFDGALLRITDQTPGHVLRSVQLEAVEEEMTTGGVPFYPKAFVRSSALSLTTLPAWGGDSQGFKHVRVKIRGMAGDTIQLRWEYQQDSISPCTDVRPTHTDCGVGVDNIEIRSIVSSSTVTTSTSLVSLLNPSTFGASVTFEATVSGNNPTGTVTFLDGATTIGTGPVGAGGVASFATSTLSVGSHSITASYAGDAGNAPSTSAALSQVVDPAPTTTSLGSSLNPSGLGQSVTFTATVTGVGPTGIVTFMDGATTLGTGALSGGVATFATSALALGGHSITASYGGDANNTGSTSAPLAQTVLPATPALTLKVNGQHPTPPIVFTTGPLALTLDVGASTYTAPVSWYWAIIVNNVAFWVTPSGLQATPAPLTVAPPVAAANVPLMNITQPAGTVLTNVFLLVDSGGAIVAADAIVSIRP